MIVALFFLFICALVYLTFASIYIFIERKQVAFKKDFYLCLIGVSIFFVGCFFLGIKLKHNIEDNTIKKFTYNKVNIYEKFVNEQIVNTTYKLAEIEYD